MLGRVFYILILFDILTRCSVLSLHMIELTASWDTKTVKVEHDTVILKHKEPFTIIVNSDEPVTKIRMMLNNEFRNITLKNYGYFYAPSELLMSNNFIDKSTTICELYRDDINKITFKMDMAVIIQGDSLSMVIKNGIIELQRKNLELTAHEKLSIIIFSDVSYADFQIRCFYKNTHDVIFEVGNKTTNSFPEQQKQFNNYIGFTVAIHDVIDTAASCELYESNSNVLPFEIKIIVKKPVYSLKQIVLMNAYDPDSIETEKNDIVLLQNEPYTILVKGFHVIFTKIQCRDISGNPIIDGNLLKDKNKYYDDALSYYTPSELLIPENVMNTSAVTCELKKNNNKSITFGMNLTVREPATSAVVLELIANWGRNTLHVINDHLTLIRGTSFSIRVYSSIPLKKIRCQKSGDLFDIFEDIILEDNGDFYAPVKSMLPRQAMDTVLKTCKLYKDNNDSISFNFTIGLPDNRNASNAVTPLYIYNLFVCMGIFRYWA